MASYSFDEDTLSKAAGVDPWQMLRDLRTGNPADIDTMAAAFYRASGHLSDAHAATTTSQTYVKHGFKVDSSSPLDGDTEAAKLVKDPHIGATHTAQIAKILTGVGSDLDTATTKSGTEVSTLDTAISGFVEQYRQLVFIAVHTGEARDDPSGIDAAEAAIWNKAVAATKTHGATVNKLLTGYETSLHTALKSMADLGYVPIDGQDEGPGGIDLTAGTHDGAATVTAAKNGNKAGLRQSTFAVSIINDAIAHDGGHVSDENYDYLYSYYGQTAKHSDVIWGAVKNDPSLKGSAGRQYADGLLNLSRGAEQTDDEGVGPYIRDEHGVGTFGRGGVDGLPQSVQDVLNSHLGTVSDASGQSMRTATYSHGHWTIANYGNDTGFTSLLTLASKGSAGGDAFSQALGEAGLRWKQDLNAVDRNTTAWLKADQTNPYTHRGGPDIDPDKIKLPDGFHGKFDANGNPIDNDTASSDALQTLARNQTASTNFLLDTGDRRTLLGLNWHDGRGAGDVIATGTAPDPSGTTGRNQATLDVMRDAGHDYKALDGLASPDVKNALTLVATRHIDTFAKDIPHDANPSDGLIVTGVDGRPEHGVFLNQGDMANYLKLVAGFGPGDYGLLHAAALERGSQYVAFDLQHGGEHGEEARTMASLLNGRVTNAGVAAANDTLRANIDSHGRADAAALLAEQKAATDDFLGKLGTDGLGIVLGGAGLIAAPETGGASAIAALAFANSTVGTVSGDVGGPGGPDPALSNAIHHIYTDLGNAQQIPSQLAQSALNTSGNEQWMAVRAQNLLPHDYVQHLPAGSAEARAYAEARSLSDGSGMPTPGYSYVPGSDVAGKLNDISLATYGSDKGLADSQLGSQQDLTTDGQGQSWGGGAINGNERNVSGNDGAWSSGDIQHSIAYGDNSTYHWVHTPPMNPHEPAFLAYKWEPDAHSPS